MSTVYVYPLKLRDIAKAGEEFIELLYSEKEVFAIVREFEELRRELKWEL